MENRQVEIPTELETAEALEAAYGKLFKALAQFPDHDSESLAQPNPMRYVPSVTTDSTQVFQVTAIPQRR